MLWYVPSYWYLIKCLSSLITSFPPPTFLCFSFLSLVALTGPKSLSFPLPDLTFDGALKPGVCFDNLWLAAGNVPGKGPTNCCDYASSAVILDNTDKCGYTTLGDAPECFSYLNTPEGPWYVMDTSVWAQVEAWCGKTLGASIPSPPLSVPFPPSISAAGIPASAGIYATKGIVGPFTYPPLPTNKYTKIKPTTSITITKPLNDFATTNAGGDGLGNTFKKKLTLNLDPGVYQLSFNYALPTLAAGYVTPDIHFDVWYFPSGELFPQGVPTAAALALTPPPTIGFSSSYPFPDPFTAYNAAHATSSYPYGYNFYGPGSGLLFSQPLLSFPGLGWQDGLTVPFTVNTGGEVGFELYLTNYSLDPLKNQPSVLDTTAAAVGLVNVVLLKHLNPETCCVTNN